MIALFDAPQPPWQDCTPSDEKILTGRPVQSFFNRFSSPDGRFHCGEWRSEPGLWRVAFSECEFCHLLEGVVVVTDEQGLAKIFKAGDRFVIASGFRGTWEVVEAARKLYVVYE
jgi:uncharacterized protein